MNLQRLATDTAQFVQEDKPSSETTKDESRINKTAQETFPRQMKTAQDPKDMSVEYFSNKPERETIVVNAARSKNTEKRNEATTAPKHGGKK